LFKIITHRTDSVPGTKGGTVVAARKRIPHKHLGLLSVVSKKATAVCIPICKYELLLAAVN
jgi:hypothetical protein